MNETGTIHGTIRERFPWGRDRKRKGREEEVLDYSSIHRYCPNARARIGWMP